MEAWFWDPDQGVAMRRFHSLLFSSIVSSAFGLATAASAAPPLPPPPVWTWTGFYAGVNVGYSWGRSNSTLTLSDASSGAALASGNSKFDLDGVIGGGQIGYNWQDNDWVYGLEADIQGSAEKGSTNFTCAGGTAAVLNGPCSLGHLGDTTPVNIPAFPVSDSLSESLDWFGTLRGRLGHTVTPTSFAYITGGLAYGQISATDTVSGTNLIGPQGTNGATIVPVAASLSNSTIKAGWTVGVGYEGVLVGNWSGKIEYLYMDLGTVSGSFVTPVVAPSGAFVTSSYSSRITDNILRVGINYNFR